MCDGRSLRNSNVSSNYSCFRFESQLQSRLHSYWKYENLFSNNPNESHSMHDARETVIRLTVCSMKVRLARGREIPSQTWINQSFRFAILMKTLYYLEAWVMRKQSAFKIFFLFVVSWEEGNCETLLVIGNVMFARIYLVISHIAC